MKQYCRYCINAVLTEEEIVYCDVFKKTKTKNSCITVNKCKSFDFLELDVFDTDKKYHPRVKRSKTLENQIRLEVQDES